MKTIITICFLLFGAMIIQAQRTYSPIADPDDSSRLVIDEFFPADNRNGWSIFQNEFTRTYLSDKGGYFSLSNTKQDQSYVVLLPKWQHNAESDFVVKVYFSLLKPLIKKPVGGVSGAGFAWGGNAPYRNMQVLYFRYDKPLAEYTVWNEKGEARLILEKAVPQNNKKEYSIEIQRKGGTISFYDCSKEDSLELLFSAPFQSFQGQSNIGFYVSGEMSIAAKKLQIKEAMTTQEMASLEQKKKADSLKWATERPEEFRKYNEIADDNKKKLTKYDGKNVNKLSPKEWIKYRELKENLASAYYNMASLKQDEGDIETSVVFYQLSAEVYRTSKYYYAANWEIGKIYLSKYHKSGQEKDKLIAMDYLLKGAIGEKGGNFSERPKLREYYQIKFPFITNFSFLNPNMRIPQTKEEYDEEYAKHLALQAQTAKLKQQWKILNSRPKFTALAIVIDNLQPQKSYIASTQKTVPLTQIFADDIKVGDFYFDPAKNDFVMAFADGRPLDLKTDYVFVNRDYNFQFEYDKHECSACSGTGFTASGGSYSYQVFTGRYTETRNSTIVSQTESVTRTPIYETQTISGTPKYTICKVCDGKGGQPPTKRFTVTVR